MRRLLLCGVAIVGMGIEANAADMPDFLRGSTTVVAAPGGPRWDGFYVGAHAGWSVPGIDFTNNTNDINFGNLTTAVRLGASHPFAPRSPAMEWQLTSLLWDNAWAKKHRYCRNRPVCEFI